MDANKSAPEIKLILFDLLHCQRILGHGLATIRGDPNRIFIAEADLFFRAGVLQGANQHLVGFVDVVRIRPVGERPVVPADASFVTEHADPVLEAGHHVLREPALLAEEQYLIGQGK